MQSVWAEKESSRFGIHDNPISLVWAYSSSDTQLEQLTFRAMDI